MERHWSNNILKRNWLKSVDFIERFLGLRKTAALGRKKELSHKIPAISDSGVTDVEILQFI